MKMTRKELVKRLKQIRIIYKEPVKLRSGAASTFYCDIKRAFGHPNILNALAKEVARKLPKGTTVVAASGYGGLPLGAVAASVSGKKFTAVREKAKNHGRGGKIDGYVPTARDKVVVIDDVLTTGGSIKETLSVLKKTRAKILGAVVVVRRADVKLPIPYYFIFKVEDLL